MVVGQLVVFGCCLRAPAVRVAGPGSLFAYACFLCVFSFLDGYERSADALGMQMNLHLSDLLATESDWTHSRCWPTARQKLAHTKVGRDGGISV